MLRSRLGTLLLGSAFPHVSTFETWRLIGTTVRERNGERNNMTLDIQQIRQWLTMQDDYPGAIFVTIENLRSA